MQHNIMTDIDHTSNQIRQTPAVDHPIGICTHHELNAKIKNTMTVKINAPPSFPPSLTAIPPPYTKSIMPRPTVVSDKSNILKWFQKLNAIKTISDCNVNSTTYYSTAC